MNGLYSWRRNLARPKYNKKAGKIGRQAEEYLDYLLNMTSLDYIWHNKEEESFKKWDFSVLKEDKVSFLLECESKAAKFENIFMIQGIDFLPDKVERSYPVSCYYIMPINDDKEYRYMMYISMDDILKHGKKIRKDNGRMQNESFYRVSFDLCKKLSPSIRSLND